jgi:hypothetical protein
MNTHRDRLDDAIDRIAARMTRVEENDAFASRIINALPERSMWAGGLFQSWAPRIAMIAVVVAAAIVWGVRGSRESDAVTQPLLSSQPLAAHVTFVAGVRETLGPARMPLEPFVPLAPLEPLVPGSDFEFSLPPIEAVAALQVEAVAAASLSEDAPLTLMPLAIADLPTAETISPR